MSRFFPAFERLLLAILCTLVTARGDPPPALDIILNGSDRRLDWQGDSAYSAQMFFSGNLVDWDNVGLPFTEAPGQNSFVIPLPELATQTGFFRLERRSLVNSAIPTTPGFYTNLSFVHAGIARTYFLLVPAGWNGSATWPFLLLLPGHTQSAADLSLAQAELLSAANTRGWVVAIAQANQAKESYTWFAYENPNTAAAPYHASQPQPYIDDAAFLLALVNHLQTSALSLNTARTYLGGFSNGGSMTHYLASKPSHPFAAFAIMESGNAAFAFYLDPYSADTPNSGTPIPALVPPPSAARPVLLMNMVTSIPWTFEGQVYGTAPNQLFFNGARNNVARWTQANGYGSVAQPAPETPLPPPTSAGSPNANFVSIPFTRSGTNRPRVQYSKMRPDEGWPLGLVSQGPPWTLALASNFPYYETAVPTALRAVYPHTISPDPDQPSQFIRVDSGTMTVELWRTAANDRTNEVIFVGLSDGGHQLPSPSDHLPFSSTDILDFFDAH